MHWTLVTTCYLVAWAIAAGPWRIGSIALVASWLVGQAWFCATGDALPIRVYLILDPLVIAAVLHWRGSWLDWVILAIFPLEWVAYDQPDVVRQWWTLWGLSSVQLLAAGPWPQIQRILSAVSHGPLYSIDQDRITR